MVRQHSVYGEWPSRYHVRTRTSLVDEYISTISDSGGSGDSRASSDLLHGALDRMDREGWKLVAAAGEALLFRARHTTR